MNSLTKGLRTWVATAAMAGMTDHMYSRDKPPTAARQDSAHFHHVHLNVTDRERTLAFYERFFGASRIAYRGKATALYTEKSFILLNSVGSPPRANAGTSLWHIGWAGVDGASEFRWRVAEGITVQTPLTRPVLPGLDNKADYMYFEGPDHELVEVSTVNRNHRFEHVHLLSSDIEATTDWLRDHLGLIPDHAAAINFYGVLMNIVRVDNVSIVIFARPVPSVDNQFAAKELWPAEGFKTTEGAAIDHLAFSYARIAPVLQRMRAKGVTVVRDLAVDQTHGFRSFFIRAPDNLLIEIVEEKPIPEGIWSEPL